jgi:hypothetical protein
MELYNNNNNNSLKFKINSEGINIQDIEPRLILTTNENKNYLFIGKIIENDICEFNIPKLETYNKGDNGNIKFEIISENLYFPVWKDKFEIITKASIQLESVENPVINDKNNHKKKNIEAQPIIINNNEPIKTNEIKENVASQMARKNISKSKKLKNESIDNIKNFDNFFK